MYLDINISEDENEDELDLDEESYKLIQKSSTKETILETPNKQIKEKTPKNIHKEKKVNLLKFEIKNTINNRQFNPRLPPYNQSKNLK